jgi:8-oxo-dGTP pyrophosphatase MutT (NUDIX family)
VSEARIRPVRPRDAAALILLDGMGRKTPKVLLGKRHPALKFMPNKYVFPGGRLEPGDRRMNIAGPLDARVEARLLKGRAGSDPGFARALALAAIRETFEETGHVVGTGDYGGPERPPAAGAPMPRTNACPICRNCISSPAPSPRPCGPGVSTPAFSPSTPAP